MTAVVQRIGHRVETPVPADDAPESEFKIDHTEGFGARMKVTSVRSRRRNQPITSGSPTTCVNRIRGSCLAPTTSFFNRPKGLTTERRIRAIRRTTVRVRSRFAPASSCVMITVGRRNAFAAVDIVECRGHFGPVTGSLGLSVR